LPDLQLGPIDIAIIIGYIVLTLIIGYLVGRGKEDSEGYFLAGRKLTWPLIGLSLYASNMSGSSFVGLASGGYADGVVIYHYEWLAAVILIFFLFFILPFYLRSKVFTMPEFLERRFDRRSRYIFSGQTLLLNLFIDMAGALYAGGIVIQTIFPSLPLWQTILTLTIVAGVYTVFGGLSAVVITDAIQAVVLLIGGTIVSVMGFMAIGSWGEVVQAAPPGGLTMFKPAGSASVPWPGLLGVMIIGFYFWCTNQVIVQRALGAKDVNQGRWGALFGGLLKIPALFILIFPGLFARVLYPGLENPDQAFPALAFDLLPIGLRGLVGAALVAAIMSSVDSTLNSASTLVTMDFVKNLRPKTSDKQLAAIGRMSTGIFMIFAAAWAPQIVNFENLWTYLQSILGYLVPPTVAVFILGIFWKRANRHGAFWTLAIGIPTGIILFILFQVLNVDAAFNIHFLYLNMILTALAFALMIGVSLATSEPITENIENNTWTRGVWRAESRELKQVPWYANYRILSGVLTVLALAVVLSFV